MSRTSAPFGPSRTTAATAACFSPSAGKCFPSLGMPRARRIRSTSMWDKRSEPQELPSDHQALDLARSLINGRNAYVAQVPLDGEFADVAVTAVDLHRAIANAVRCFGREELCD